MEHFYLKQSELLGNQTISISGSKSESNRLLILQRLLGDLQINNLSNAQDTQLLQKALYSNDEVIDIHHAGTAMRFLTSYFAVQEGRTTILTGSDRMKQRPIAPLVEALKSLGAEITYLEKEGCPPLKMVGKKLYKNEVSISAEVSSQFISSLLLVAGFLENGLKIALVGNITSRPYLEMTLKMLSDLGIENEFEDQTIEVKPIKKELATDSRKYTVESDWSSASYFYSLVAIGKKQVALESFKEASMQGDKALVKIYRDFFGVETQFQDGERLALIPIKDFKQLEKINLNMNDCPDIAQTVCVTAAVLGLHFEIEGLATLKVKETDRLVALKNELLKIGLETEITEDSIKSVRFFQVEEVPCIKTYHDHRMAMSFAPYALVGDIQIEDPSVVEKSYPYFWEDFKTLSKEK
ncbi:3-phosphoshikimate 1-carboxyvinyltransferase [Riemerella anatipestifer]|uniref:3-phosphoshikimate 1-carboxyvinyltransferase n=1 Tax=Riemerella anatipestifer TaxID=34085 RepID=UPI0030BB9256